MVELRRLMLVLALFIVSTFVAPTGTARAQPADAPTVGGELAVPVEIVLETINSEVRCGPPQARLPIEDEVEMRFINRSKQPIMFVAPDFFTSADILESSGFALEAAVGGFLAAPESTVRILLRTPPADEYGYACHGPGEPPSPRSSGYLVVGSLDAESVRIPPRPQDDTESTVEEEQ